MVTDLQNLLCCQVMTREVKYNQSSLGSEVVSATFEQDLGFHGEAGSVALSLHLTVKTIQCCHIFQTRADMTIQVMAGSLGDALDSKQF